MRWSFSSAGTKSIGHRKKECCEWHAVQQSACRHPSKKIDAQVFEYRYKLEVD